MTEYTVGNDRVQASDSHDALFKAAKMLEGEGVGVRVNIYANRSLYAWLQYKIGIGDGQPHLIYFKPRVQFGRPVASDYKVIVRGTRWTKDKSMDKVRCI